GERGMASNRSEVGCARNVPAPRPDSESLVKGSGLIIALHWLDRAHGRPELMRLRERMGTPWRDVVDFERTDFGLLAGTWYPASLVNAIYDALIEGMPAAYTSSLARRLGTAIAEGLITGVNKYLFSLFVNPERYVSNLWRMWRQNWTDGHVDARMLGRNQVEIRLSAWKGHHVFNCQINNYIAVAIFEKMGIRKVNNTWRCRTTYGGPDCICDFVFPLGR